MPRNRVPSWWVTLHQAKTCLGEESSWSSVWKCGGGGEKHVRPDQVRTELHRGSKWGKPNPPKEGHLPYDPSQDREQSHKRKPKTSTWENSGGRCQGRRKGILGAEGWLPSHTLWSDSDLESVTGPQEMGRGIYQAFAFSRKTDTEETCVGRYWSFKYLRNHLPNSKETVIFQYLPYY